MRILHVDQHYRYSGGTEQYYLDIMEMLEEAGHKVGMVYGVKDERTLRFPHRAEYHVAGIEAIPESIPIAETLEELRSAVRKENPDVINIHNIRNFHVIEALSNMKPTVRFIHDPTLCCFRDWKLLPGLNELCAYPVGWRCYSAGCLKDFPVPPVKAILLKRSELRAHKKIDRILVASRYMKDLLVLNGIPGEKIGVLPHFTRMSPPTTGKSDTAENIILFAGLIHHVKGVDKLIKALALMKSKFKAYLIGDGPYLEQYRRLAADEGVGDRISFLGWVDHDRMKEYYSKASVVVVPSWWIEPFGIVGIEAMAHAKPVVAFDTGGIRDWLENDSTGFLVPRGDVAAFAARVDELLSDKALASEMGANARLAAEKKYDREHYLPKLMDVYENCLNS